MLAQAHCASPQHAHLGQASANAPPTCSHITLCRGRMHSCRACLWGMPAASPLLPSRSLPAARKSRCWAVPPPAAAASVRLQPTRPAGQPGSPGRCRTQCVHRQVSPWHQQWSCQGGTECASCAWGTSSVHALPNSLHAQGSGDKAVVCPTSWPDALSTYTPASSPHAVSPRPPAQDAASRASHVVWTVVHM